MKLFKLFTLMAAGTMITACNNEIENLSRNADNRVMSLQTAGKAYTRFNDVTNTWENTDKIGVYMYGAGTGSTDILNGAENVLFTTQGGESPVNLLQRPVSRLRVRMPSLQLIIRKMEILPAVFIKLHWEIRQKAMLLTI